LNAGSRSLLPPAGTVDVWRIPLDVPAGVRARLVQCLDDDERGQVARMRGGERWGVARAARREILARCCGVAAGALRFEANAHGKPRLAGCPSVHFNMSARAALALLAISSDGPVGVDLERDDIPGDIHEVARRFLPAEDAAAIVAAAPGDRPRRFAIAWTRFEALRKLRGLGIDDAPPGEGRAATVRTIEAPGGFVAAIAMQGDGWSVREREALDVL
jgi:4'-phosphopantetheinyl transferase